MSTFWARVRKDFGDVFPDGKRPFGRVLLVGSLFGIAIVTLLGFYDTNFGGVKDSIIGAVLPPILLLSMVAYVAGPELGTFFRGESNAATVRMLLRWLIFLIGGAIGLFIAILSILLLGVNVFR